MWRAFQEAAWQDVQRAGLPTYSPRARLGEEHCSIMEAIAFLFPWVQRCSVGRGSVLKRQAG